MSVEVIDTELAEKKYKFRLYPNSEQRQFLAQCFGSARFVYNHFLGLDKQMYEETSKTGKGKKLSWAEHNRMLTQLKREEGYEWLSDVPSIALVASLNHLKQAWSNFFRNIGKNSSTKRVGSPKFKNRYSEQSISLQQFRGIRNRIEYGRLYTTKFNDATRRGNYGPIKINVHRPFNGKIGEVTISKSKTGKYYAVISLKEPHRPLPSTGKDKKVGIDVGLKELAVLSDGTRYENPKFMEKYLKKLKYEQGQLSKKKRGSKSRQRQRLKVAKVHEDIKNARSTYLNTVSKDIVRNNDTIIMEGLSVKEMMSTKHGNDKKSIRRGLGDVGLGEFTRMIEYKSKWNKRQFKKIDKYFPSSKLCSDCGWKNENLELRNRTWVCESCGVEHDRDLNAAKNILKEGCKDI